MKQSLHLKTVQRLTLTPQLKKSLEILQLPFIELENLVSQELVDNPLLELHEVAENDLSSMNAIDHATTIGHATTEGSGNQPDAKEITEWQDQHHPNANYLPISTEKPLEQTIAVQESLYDHLLSQVNLTNFSPRDQTIAEHLLRCLDDEGYLTLSPTEVVALLPPQLQAQASEVKAVLSLIKTLEPLGAGTRNLQERLHVLLASIAPETKGLQVAKKIVDQHLDLLAKRDFVGLSNRLNIDQNQLATSIELITKQNPRIANRFSQQFKNQISADIIVSMEADKWVAKLNSANQLKLTINQSYASLLKQSNDQQSTEFIEQNSSSAKTFINSIRNRYDTLLAVSSVIVGHQQDFFAAGSVHLRPLTMRAVAEQLEIHESTVSRAVAGKYVLCNQGIFDLKHFFSCALGGTDDSSAAAIRSLIQKMVSAESPVKPLSDSKIAKQLEDEGHLVARRTVAKYRKSLQIAPSSLRKKLLVTN